MWLPSILKRAPCKCLSLNFDKASRVWVCARCGKTYRWASRRGPISASVAVILEAQAKAAEKRGASEISAEGTTLAEFLEVFAARLCQLWRGQDAARARWLCLDFMEACGMEFPSLAFDWSLAAARDLADIYAEEFGETRGAN